MLSIFRGHPLIFLSKYLMSDNAKKKQIKKIISYYDV
ncbi:hypothetical protein SAMN05444349_10270 [Bacteroides faecichinchillae]|uniref:Uncharacterized protein n=1 Tax=Bacteroides faecichinchillae TaxID=871325 RepID=A0A1M4TBM3_9BACE|nr:hypothetical protein SAMN05444349_10270 [Bacteroides faecichinchillae]